MQKPRSGRGARGTGAWVAEVLKALTCPTDSTWRKQMDVIKKVRGLLTGLHRAKEHQ